jgi:hypothetical protein
MEIQMSLSVLRRSANRPLIAAVWLLTLTALIPFSTLPGLLFGGLLNLAANILAIVLICSPSIADRIHGGLRLGLQVAILVIGAILLVRSGATLDGLLHFVMQKH